MRYTAEKRYSLYTSRFIIILNLSGVTVQRTGQGDVRVECKKMIVANGEQTFVSLHLAILHVPWASVAVLYTVGAIFGEF